MLRNKEMKFVAIMSFIFNIFMLLLPLFLWSLGYVSNNLNLWEIGFVGTAVAIPSFYITYIFYQESFYE